MNRRLFYRGARQQRIAQKAPSERAHPPAVEPRQARRTWRGSSTEMRLRSPPRVKRRSSAASSCVRREAVVEIILDASGSMEGEAITLAKVACIRLLEALRAVTGVKASLTIFPGPNRRSVTCAADFQHAGEPCAQARRLPSGVRCDADPSGVSFTLRSFSIKDRAREDRLRHHRRLVPQRGRSTTSSRHWKTAASPSQWSASAGTAPQSGGSIIAKAEKIADLPRAVAASFRALRASSAGSPHRRNPRGI